MRDGFVIRALCKMTSSDSQTDRTGKKKKRSTNYKNALENQSRPTLEHFNLTDVELQG